MIEIIKLDSGIRLILDKMDSVKSVSIGIWCKTGSVNEKPEEEGISHFIEHMLFKGTSKRDAFKIVQEMESIGAEVNAFTSKERTCFYAKCIDENVLQAADILADMIEDPLFDSHEMEREKLVVIEEINMNADDPDDVAMDKFDEIVFDGSKLSHPVLGSKETVKSFTHDSVFKYYREHYTKESIVVSVAGNFDKEKIINFFNNRFNNLASQSRVDRDAKPVGKPVSVTVNKDIEQAHIILGHTTIPANDERRYHLSLLSILLGGGMSSRLFQNIREKKGLAYSVYSSNSFYDNEGQFGIVAGVSKDRVDEFIAAVKEEIDNLNNNPITEEEFNTAKIQLISSFIFSLENTQSRMRTNGKNFFSYGFCIDQNELVKKLEDITLQDIEKSKSLISDFSKYSIVNVTGNSIC